MCLVRSEGRSNFLLQTLQGNQDLPPLLLFVSGNKSRGVESRGGLYLRSGSGVEKMGEGGF